MGGRRSPCCLHLCHSGSPVGLFGFADGDPNRTFWCPKVQAWLLHCDVLHSISDSQALYYDVSYMITAAQLRASRALLGIDQRKLAELSALSLPTIQRMEASEGVIRCNVDSLMKLVAALGTAGVELISDNAASAGGGRGVRLKRAAS